MSISNGIDPTVAQRWMGEALRVYGDLDELKTDNMNRARVIRARLPVIYEGAKAAGLPVRALKQSVRKVLLERKIEGLQEDIEELKPEDEDDAAAFELLQQALGGFGDTPLGAATLDAAADKREKAAAKKAAKTAGATKPENQAETSTSDQDAADEALVRQNTARLEAGISELPPAEPFEDDATATKPSRRAVRAAKLEELH